MSANFSIPTPTLYARMMVERINYKGNLIGMKVLENSCGEGNILCEIVRAYIESGISLGYSKKEIADNINDDIYAIDINAYLVENCISRLNSILAEFEIPDIKWDHVIVGDYLSTTFHDVKFDFIFSNPPYITYQDIPTVERKLLRQTYKSCSTGRFDYYYAFVEKGIHDLKNETGKMIYLIPYSIFSNKFAINLRNQLLPYVFEVWDYSGIEIFSHVVISSVIIALQKSLTNKVIIYSVKNNRNQIWDKNDLENKWCKKVQSILPKRFGDFFDVSNSIATLANDVFILRNYHEDDDYIYSGKYKVEKGLVYECSSLKLERQYAKSGARAKIIYPYQILNDQVLHIAENDFKKMYPYGYSYLKSMKQKLLKRTSNDSIAWFEYGRGQALSSILGDKIIMSMVISKKMNLVFASDGVVPCAGYFIKCLPGSELTLQDAKKILESQEFLDYVHEIGTPTVMGSYRISVNDVREYRFS